jgi:hypothetical protein
MCPLITFIRWLFCWGGKLHHSGLFTIEHEVSSQSDAWLSQLFQGFSNIGPKCLLDLNPGNPQNNHSLRNVLVKKAVAVFIISNNRKWNCSIRSHGMAIGVFTVNKMAKLNRLGFFNPFNTERMWQTTPYRLVLHCSSHLRITDNRKKPMEHCWIFQNTDSAPDFHTGWKYL